MARFSKAALLKWLREQKTDADHRRSQAAKAKKRSLEDFHDGRAVALAEAIDAIVCGQIGEE